ncbi:MAG: glycosyltransferase family 2 protein [Methylocystaceae bacterium]
MINISETNTIYIPDCTLAIVIPIYNEAKTLQYNISTIKQTLENDGITASIILIDDGSEDATWLEIGRIIESMDNVYSLRFSRNFGKEAAIFAGLANVNANYYLIMDSDLQHPPRYIKEMLTLALTEQADIVEAVKTNRGKESLFYRFMAKGFYKLLTGVSGLELDNSSDFKLLTRQVVDAIRTFNEGNVFFRGLVDWAGFNKARLLFEVDEREGDTSRFSNARLILMALNATLAYSSKPLYLTVFSGVVFFIISIILTIQTIYNYVIGFSLSGFSTVIILILFTGSMTMLSLGIIGAYISRIYNEVKARPRYIISEAIEGTEKSKEKGN